LNKNFKKFVVSVATSFESFIEFSFVDFCKFSSSIFGWTGST